MEEAKPLHTKRSQETSPVPIKHGGRATASPYIRLSF
jgi:hypothetical protein